MLLKPAITQLVAGKVIVQVFVGFSATPFESSAVTVNEAGAPFEVVSSNDEVTEIVA